MRRGVALLFLAGALSAQSSTPAPTGAIRGVVKDTTGAPASGISVTANFATVPQGASVTMLVKKASSSTDETGIYALTGLPPGTYVVRAEHDRATSVSRPVKLDADREVTLDFVIPAHVSIGGRVLNRNQEPEIDAFVWLLKAEYQAGVLRQTVIGPQVTGEDGAYTFETGLEANRRYFVLADRPPPDELVPAASADLKDRQPIEAPTYYPSATRMESATPVILQPGERRGEVDIKIATAAFYCIDGKIEVSGKAASYSFAVHDSVLAGTNLARLRGSAAEDGAFHACGLSPGQYQLSTDGGATEFAVSDSDLRHVDLSVDAAHLRLLVEWDGDSPPPEAPRLDAAGEATLRKIAARMGMGDPVSEEDLKKLAARVAQRFAEPDPDKEFRSLMSDLIADPDTAAEMGRLFAYLRPGANQVSVTLGRAGASPVQQPAMIPSEGPFAGGIPPGDYTVEIQPFRANNAYVKEVTYDNLKLADGVLRIAPAASGTLRVLMAHGAGTLTVSVTDTEGNPVPGATVIVIPDSATSVSLLSRATTRGPADQNGSYTSPPLAPGKYRILATAQSVRWEVPEDLEKVLLVSFQAKEVELASNGTAQVTVQAAPIY